MSPDEELQRETARRVSVPWWRIGTAVLLAVALAISVSAGRVIESIVIALLLMPTLALLVVWNVAQRRDARSRP